MYKEIFALVLVAVSVGAGYGLGHHRASQYYRSEAILRDAAEYKRNYLLGKAAP